MKTIIEPFRIKMVEPIRLTTPAEREAILPAGPLQPVPDPGRGRAHRPADRQRHVGDEQRAVGRHAPRRRVVRRGARAGSASRRCCSDLTGMPHILPTHQGRASERILFELVGGPGKVVPSNNHFDTTRANIEHSGAEAVDLVIDEGTQPAEPAPVQGEPGPGQARGADRRGRRREHPARAWSR